MGFFDSKYITTVGTTVSRGVEDKYIISSAKTGMIAGLFKDNGEQLVEHTLESMANSMGIRTERMYSYAKANYPHGLPKATVYSIADGKAVVLAKVTQVVGANTNSYYHLGPLNNLHAGWMTVCSTYGYLSSTNELPVLSATKGYPVYLKDLVSVVKEATLEERSNGSLEQWGPAANAGNVPNRVASPAALQTVAEPTPFRVDAAASGDSVTLSYVWEVPTTVIITPATTKLVNGVSTVVPAVTVVRKILQTEEVSLVTFVPAEDYDYFQVRYIKNNNAGYWLYRLGAGTHVEIDAIFNSTPTTPGEFLPNIYFRHLSTSQDTNKTSVAYKTSQKMAKYLGVDYQAMIEAIHENPDIAQVDQALMTFAVPANTTNPLEQQYLFTFFDKLYLASGGVAVGGEWTLGRIESSSVEVGDGGTMETSHHTAASLLLNKILNGIDTSPIRVTIEDKLLKTGLSCQGIFKRKKAGVIAAVGEYTSTFIVETISYKYTTNEVIGHEAGSTWEYEGAPIYSEVEQTLVRPIDSYLYRKQITSNVYEEIQVYDLKMTYYMWGGYSTLGDNLDAILLVPLDHSILKTYPLADKENLYARSIHYVFNSRVVTKVKWYQQSIVGDLLTAAAIIWTVASLGADGGAAYSAAIAIGATAGQAALIAAVVVLGGILTSMLIVEGLKIFVKLVGTKLAFIAAVIATIYGGFKAIEAGSIKGAPWAAELLQLGNGLASAVSSTIAEAMQALTQEAKAFDLLIAEKTELLEDANKLLEQQTLLSPFVIFGENPDEFYNRTIHAGNIGILGIDSIASYVDIALTLPTINDTLKGYSYA